MRPGEPHRIRSDPIGGGWSKWCGGVKSAGEEEAYIVACGVLDGDLSFELGGRCWARAVTWIAVEP